MFRRIVPSVIVCLTLRIAAAEAGAINADWMLPGDGLAMLDTSNNLEWLDLTQTVNMTIDAVAAELGTGGMFEGWRFATQAEVDAMLISAGATTINDWDTGNVAAVELLFSVWGELGIEPFRGTRSSYFAIDYPSNPNIYVGGAISLGNEVWHPGEGAAFSFAVVDLDHNRANAYSGSALVRDAAAAVPEPSALMLWILGAAGMWRQACRHRQTVGKS